MAKPSRKRVIEPWEKRIKREEEWDRGKTEVRERETRRERENREKEEDNDRRVRKRETQG